MVMILFFYGADSYRSKEKLNELRQKFLTKDRGGFNLVEIDGGKMSFDDWHKTVATASLLGDKRMVVIENFFKQPKNIQQAALDFLKAGDWRDGRRENIIVFWEGELKEKDKKGALYRYLREGKYCQEFNLLQGNALKRWIKKQIEAAGLAADSAVINYLAEISDGDLWALKHEIKKITAESSGRALNLEAVKKSYLMKNDENIFNLVEAVAMKRKKQALKLLENQFEAQANGLYILTMLVRQFRLLVQVKSFILAGGKNYRAAAAELRQPVFVVRRLFSQAPHFELKDLKAVYQRLLHIDTQIKNGGDARLLLELFVLSL